MSFFAELKQRNVVRVAILYIVGAWLILQVADVLFGIFQLPPSSLSLVATVLAIAFIPALILAWVFEVTPEGIKRESDIDRSAGQKRRSGKRMTVVTMGLLVVAIALFVSEPMWRGDKNAETNVARDASTEDAVVTPAADVELGIAVLPFASLSADEDNVFFAGGVHEEVLGNLARISGLRVISRTSMLRIADTNLDVRGIGARLGVSHVLEGSVRRAAERVRVSVQLINATDDEQIWSESYDATLDDIFTIQSDIAQQIASSLRTTLTPDAVSSMQARPTDSQAAYDLYVRALQERDFWRGADTFTTMRAQLEEALRLDPNFIEARVLLLTAYGRLYWLRSEKVDDVFAERAAEQLALIEAQAPTSIAAKKAKAFYTYLVEYDYETTLELLQPLHEELPNNTEILQSMSSSLKRLNDNERFLDAARRLYLLDPESAVTAGELGFALTANGLFAEAEALARDTVQSFPEDVSSLGSLFQSLMIREKLDEAYDIFERYAALDSEARYWNERLWLVYAIDGVGATRDALEPASENPQSLDAIAEMALILRHAGGSDREATELAETAFELGQAMAEKRLPDLQEGTQSQVYAHAAKWAAIAGDRDAYMKYRQRYEDLRAGRTDGQWSYFAQNVQVYALAVGQAVLGDAEGGWAMLKPSLGATGLSHFDAGAIRARNDLVFGDVSDYQEFISQNRPAWTASLN